MPNLFERIAHNSVAGVSQARIFPAQYDRDLRGEILLRAVDIADVHDPHPDGDLSRSEISSRSIDHRGCFRAEPGLDRRRKQNKKCKVDFLHQVATAKRKDSVSEFVQPLELPAD